MTHYIRLKRKNQTIFLHVESSTNFSQVKQRVAEILNMPDPNRIMLLASDKVSAFTSRSTTVLYLIILTQQLIIILNRNVS